MSSRNTLLLDALHCQNKQRPPIWLMRQAGRYMPEYRAIRERHSFLEMCHQPEIAAKVTKLPIQAFGFDAAILFADILLIPEALQLGLRVEDGIGPVFERPLVTPADIANLPTIDVSEALSEVGETVRLLKSDLEVPLLGFCGAPFTVASYMIEGKSSRDLRKTKQWMLRDPESFHLLLSKLTDLSIDYLKMQIVSGVDAVQVFDSWAHVLAPTQFREFSLRYLQRIVEALKEVPVILFCRGASVHASEMALIKPAALSIDWNVELAKLRASVSPSIALQGNLDPDILYASHATIRKEAKNILNGMKDDPGFIFNLGHGILPDIPVDAVKVLIETVQESK